MRAATSGDSSAAGRAARRDRGQGGWLPRGPSGRFFGLVGLLAVAMVGMPIGAGAQASGDPAPAAPAAAAGAASTGTGAGAPSTTSAPATPPSAAEQRALARAVRSAQRHLSRKRYDKAAAAFEKVLEKAPSHAEARFGVAAALCRLGQHKRAVEELGKLAASGTAEAPVWLVEARLSPHFRDLLTDTEFRRTVGIDRDPERSLSAYERLVGQGGHWEQAGTPCAQPEVALTLDRRAVKERRKFTLVIRNRCQGEVDTTRLSGRWVGVGDAELRLVFPNPGAADETITCALEDRGAATAVRDDAVRCDLGDAAFDLRTVRR